MKVAFWEVVVIIFYIFSCLIFDVLHEVKFIFVWDIISRVKFPVSLPIVFVHFRNHWFVQKSRSLVPTKLYVKNDCLMLHFIPRVESPCGMVSRNWHGTFLSPFLKIEDSQQCSQKLREITFPVMIIQERISSYWITRKTEMLPGSSFTRNLSKNRPA